MKGIDVTPGVLRTARLQARMTLAQVAGDELSRQLVHAIEKGKARPSMASLKVICSRLGIPIEVALPSDTELISTEGAAIAELARLTRQYKFQQATQRGEELLPQLTSALHIAYCHYYVGEALTHLARPTEAIDRLRLARQLFDTLGKPVAALEAMDYEADAMTWAGDPRDLAVAEEALERCRSLDRPPADIEARILARVAYSLRRRGDFEIARRRYEEALQRADQVADRRHLARIYQGLAVSNFELGDYGRGIDVLRKALQLYEAEEGDSGEPYPPVAGVKNDLGVALTRAGRLAEAEPLLLDAIARSRGNEDPRTSHIFCSLAELRLAQGRLDESLVEIDQATELALRFDNRRALAEAHRLRGAVESARRESAKAQPAQAPDAADEAALGDQVEELGRLCRECKYLRVVELGAELLPQLTSPANIAYCQYFVGQALSARHRLVEAIDRLRLARQMLETQGDIVGALECMAFESSALLAAGDDRDLTLAQEALERCRSLDPSPGDTESRLLTAVASALFRHGDFTGARARYKEALKRAEKVRDLQQMARIYHGLGAVESSLTGPDLSATGRSVGGDHLSETLEQAVTLLTRAKELYEAAQRSSGESRVWLQASIDNDLGYAFLRKGELVRAESLLQASLQGFMAVGADGDYARSHCLNSLAELRLLQLRLDEALTFINDATELAERHDNKRALAEAHRLRGAVQSALRESATVDGERAARAALDESALIDELGRLCQESKYLQVLERGEALLPQLTAPANIAWCHHFVGQALTHRWRLGEAMARLQTARQMFEMQENAVAAVEVMCYEAQALGGLGDKRALVVAQEALERCRSLDPLPPDTESRVLIRVATSLFRTGDLAAARGCYEEALDRAGQVKDLRLMARIYHGLGSCEVELERAGQVRGEERLVSGNALTLLARAKHLYEAEQRVSGEPKLFDFDLAVVDNDLAVVLIKDGQLLQAEQLVLSGLQRFMTAGPDAEYYKAHILNTLAEVCLLQGRLDEAVRVLDEAAELGQRHANKRAQAETERLRGLVKAARGEAVKVAGEGAAKAALTADESALVGELERLCRQGKFEQAAARADELLPLLRSRISIGYCHFFQGQALRARQRVIEAIDRLRRARQIFEEEANIVAALDAMQEEAAALDGVSDPGAIGLAKEALRRCRALDPPAPELEARILVQVATILMRQGDLTEARARYEEALGQAGHVRDVGLMAGIYHGLAMAHKDTAEFSTYFNLLTTARTMYEAQEGVSGEPQRNLAAIENDIGMALMGVGRLDQAELQFQAALKRFDAMGAAGESAKGRVFTGLAELRLQQGRLDDALVLLDQATDLAERHGNMSVLGSAYLLRAQFHETRGEPDQAIEWLRKGVRAVKASGVDPSKLPTTALAEETAPSATGA